MTKQSRAEQSNSAQDKSNVNRIVNIPAELDKKSGEREGNFVSADNFRIMKVNKDLASCVTARYFKGLSAHGDNLVIVQYGKR